MWLMSFSKGAFVDWALSFVNRRFVKLFRRFIFAKRRFVLPEACSLCFLLYYGEVQAVRYSDIWRTDLFEQRKNGFVSQQSVQTY